MASFRHRHDELQHELPWLLMQNGPVTKYWRREYFEADIAELLRRDYWVPRFDCSSWRTEREMHQVLKAGLQLPDYIGDNLAALEESFQYAPIPDHSGLMIALDNFTETHLSDALLNTLAHASRYSLLFGRILGILLRTDDADYQGKSVGVTPINWNQREKGHRGP